MIRFTQVTVFILTAVMIALGAGQAIAEHHESKDHESRDIVDTAAGAGSFTVLIAAVQAAGLEETLRGEGPYTVFAPTDEAFAALPDGTVENLLKPENKDQLVAILTYHVVAGEVMSDKVAGMKEAESVNGKGIPIAVNDGKVMVDNANVTKADIKASNGVIHVIDAVILPDDN